MRKWNKIQRCPFSVVEWFIYTFIVIMTISYSNTKKPTKHAACSHNHLKYAIAIGCVKINVLRTIAITQRHFNSLTSFFRVQSAKNLRKTGSTSCKKINSNWCTPLHIHRSETSCTRWSLAEDRILKLLALTHNHLLYQYSIFCSKDCWHYR